MSAAPLSHAQCCLRLFDHHQQQQQQQQQQQNYRYWYHNQQNVTKNIEKWNLDKDGAWLT